MEKWKTDIPYTVQKVIKISAILYNMKCIVENMILQYMKYSAKYHVFPYYTFNVISRKIDFLWDSMYNCTYIVRERKKMRVTYIIEDTAQQEDGGQGLKIIHYMLLLPVVL